MDTEPEAMYRLAAFYNRDGRYSHTFLKGKVNRFTDGDQGDLLISDENGVGILKLLDEKRVRGCLMGRVGPKDELEFLVFELDKEKELYLAASDRFSLGPPSREEDRLIYSSGKLIHMDRVRRLGQYSGPRAVKHREKLPSYSYLNNLGRYGTSDRIIHLELITLRD